jgi:hypothetical protein
MMKKFFKILDGLEEQKDKEYQQIKNGETKQS